MISWIEWLKSYQTQRSQDSIYNHFMKNPSLLCLALLLMSYSCSISEIMFQSTSINYTHLLCLQSRGALDEFFIQVELQSTEQFKFLISSVDFDGLATLSSTPHFNVTLYSLHFYVPPETSAQIYVSTLQKYQYKMLWFDVARTEDEIDCQKIWTFVSKLAQISGSKVGIIGNRKQWARKFGSANACSQFSVFPLYYNGINSFEPFAGWDAYQFSVGEVKRNVCGIGYYQDVMVLRGQLTSELARE